MQPLLVQYEWEPIIDTIRVETSSVQSLRESTFGLNVEQCNRIDRPTSGDWTCLVVPR